MRGRYGRSVPPPPAPLVLPCVPSLDPFLLCDCAVDDKTADRRLNALPVAGCRASLPRPRVREPLTSGAALLACFL